MKKALTHLVMDFGEFNWCVLCASVVLLGNCWNALISAPEEVMLAYAAVSSAFVVITMASLFVRNAFTKR